MRRLTERWRGLVGKGSAEEAIPPGTEEAAVVPAPVAEPVAAPRPIAPVRTVDAALAMLQAFPKDTDDDQRLHALRAALTATVEDKNQTLQQLLAEVLQEKSRIASVLQNQDKNFDLQQLKITEAVDALWEKRDRLTEHHQRITLQGKEHLEGLDNLIQCLTQIQSSKSVPVALGGLSIPPPLGEIASSSTFDSRSDADDGPVVIRLPKMELRPLGEDLGTETSGEGASDGRPNPRKLYSKPA